jgi:bacillolysin
LRQAIAAGAALSAGLYAVLSTVAPAGAATVSGPTSTASASTGSGSTDPGATRALARLRGDADKPLRVHGDGSGRVTFVGTRAHDTIDNPTVTPTDGPVTAARRDLDRYGDALGLDNGDAGMRTAAARPAVSGGTVVRFDQTVDGLPVIGGQVVVSLDRDGGTSSILSTTSAATRASRARVSRADAAATAVALTARTQHRPAASLTATDGSLAVFDPATFGATSDTGVRTVRSFEVSSGTDVRERVLVDAVTGRVILHVDDVETALNRKVCDQKNARKAEANCGTGAARTEGAGPVSSPADVNTAYDLSGEVSQFYSDIGGFDLTNLIGFNTSGSKTLGSTVRFCEPSDTDPQCPYKNAFWNGQQMFYGAGFAGADDVVGHEMTHGVIERTSNLFYFFQSGAINESLADTMGEIVDHRFGPLPGKPADTANSWTIGEDLPIGAVRSLSNPPAFDQPDKMTSTRYDADTGLSDDGGVHTNSGVGNKTAYLIMHGGTFNGVTVTGIDAGDPSLTKSAKLYLDVIEKLTSGSDYADLGRQLNQSCADMVTAGTAGMDSNDCANVAKAVQATELAKQPTVANASTPTDAPLGCPSGQSKDVLFDSESGSDPAGKFSTFNGQWTRAPGQLDLSDGAYPVPSNAVTGDDSWFGIDPDPEFGDHPSSSIVLKNPITVPKGGKTYMRFDHWYAFDYDASSRKYYDGGLVLVDNTGDSAAAQQTSGLPWVNGPKQRIVSGGSAPTGFGGVSHGYTSSRVDLSSYAGKKIKAQFQTRGDNVDAMDGWYLDDIEVYSCGADLPSKPASGTIVGGLGSAQVSWTAPAWAGDGITDYRVSGPGPLEATVPPNARSAPRFTGLTPGENHVFTVRALNQEGKAGAGTTATVSGTRFSGPGVVRTGTTQTRVTGTLFKGSTGLAGRVVQVQRRASGGPWSTVTTTKTDSKGHVAVTLGGRSTALYHLVFPGGTGLLGRTSGSKHL